MNFTIWRQAITTMPQLNKTQWDQLDWFAKWLIATRASVFLMTLSSAGIGGLLVWMDGRFDLGLFIACAIGLTFAHASNNLINDLTDSARGIDKDNYYRNQYGIHVLEQGFMTKREFWRYLLITASIAIAAGMYLVLERSGATLALMSAGAFFVLFYTWPLKYIGLGEPSVLLVWGPLMVGGTYYVVGGQWSWGIALLSCVYALGPTSVLFGKHTDKADADEAKGVHSLPVILGQRRACHTVIAMLISQYLLALTLLLSGILHWPIILLALNLASLKRSITAFREPPPAQKPDDFPSEIWPLWYAPHAFDHTRKFSACFLLALIIEGLLYR
jgi:1,4-dihydroxy-2-naphthoate octaprenyltransferase